MKLGRYNFIRASKWSEPGFRDLSPNAKLILLALETGELANMAGIGPLYPEALERATSLSRPEVDNALAELQKRAVIVVDQGIAWVKSKLGDDPAREGDPEISNEKHRKGVETILGSLPKTNAAVKKFRVYYNFPLDTLSKGSRRGPDRASKGSRSTESASASASENKNASASASDLAASAARPGGGAPPPQTQTNPPTMVMKSNGTRGEPLPQAEVDRRRFQHRDRLIADGMPRNKADTLAGQIVAGEVHAFARDGRWPVPSLYDLEREIKRERPDLPGPRVEYWALMRHLDYEAGQLPRQITEGRP
jgi:hypothetical protein